MIDARPLHLHGCAIGDRQQFLHVFDAADASGGVGNIRIGCPESNSSGALALRRRCLRSGGSACPSVARASARIRRPRTS